MKITARQYINAVRRKIPIRDMRERITQSLRLSCESFETEHPDADRKMYCAHFGTPEQIGINALQSCDPNDICLAIKRNRKVRTASLSVIAAIVLLIWGMCMYLCYEVYRDAHGYFIETSYGIKILSPDDTADILLASKDNTEEKSSINP